jgi:hypothetical protein
MPDEPNAEGWSAEQVKGQLDKLVKNVVVPAHNGLVEDLAGHEAAGYIGTKTGETVQTVIDGIDEKASGHIGDRENPHDVTKAQVGLGEVADERQYSAQNPPPYPVSGVNGKTGEVSLYKGDIGLGNVTNDAQVKRSEVVQGVGNSMTDVMSQDAVTKAIGDAGGGDMMKATYDTTATA